MAFGAVSLEVLSLVTTSLSTWLWTRERSEFLDLIQIFSSSMVLVLTPQSPEIDLGLLVRPFRNDVWAVIGILFILILVCVLVPYARITYFEDTQGYQVR